MTLEDFGFNDQLNKFRKDQNLETFEVGRILSEHKDRYVVKTTSGEFDSELIGNLRFTAESRYDFPAVGDWVAISEYDDNKALIHAIYPRSSIIERQAVGKHGQKQIIATNIDFGLIVLSANRDFNINRLERYLTICNASNVEPIIILNKIDLVDEIILDQLIKKIHDRINEIPVIAISNQSLIGIDKLVSIIEKTKTYCLLGSSGVGKSTLLNNLMGKDVMKTGSISQNIGRGKHITSHRELILLNNGGILIDNPGMREVGITDSTSGLDTTFEAILNLSHNCKFKNCTHINEKGCAILEALKDGNIDIDSYNNYRKMEQERAHFESSIEERKKKDKSLSKLIKNVKKHKKHFKF